MLSDKQWVDGSRPAFLIDADLIRAFIDVPVLLEVYARQKELSAVRTFPVVLAHKGRH
jgi:hypothetical protein